MGKNDNHNYRLERKFFLTGVTKHEVESAIKHHPAMFSEIYHQRFVNNIYFDSLDLKNYFDNVEGSTRRKKVRIRWYGELFGPVNKPVLELKIKDGFLGRKESFPLPPFEIDQNFNVLTISKMIAKAKIPELRKTELKSLQPVLLNRYTRKYFQSADKHYRITIDTDLIFYRIGQHNNSFLNKFTNDYNVILEVKYDQDQDERASFLTAHFPYRLTRSSKYVTGVDRFYIW